MFLAAFGSEQLEQMHEKYGDTPVSSREAINLIAGLSSFPDRLS